jgi:tetratricopeptide (TPR) repeat protein
MSDKFNFATDSQLHESISHYNRGIADFRLGDRQGAIINYDLAIALEPNFAEAYNNRGLAKAELGECQEAISDYNLAVCIDPRLAKAYNNRGNTKAELNDLHGAIIDYSLAIKFNPNLVEAHYNLASAKFANGDDEAALSDCDRAIALDPNDAEAYYLSGIINERLGHRYKAVNDLEVAAHLFRQQDNLDAYQRVISLSRKLLSEISGLLNASMISDLFDG